MFHATKLDIAPRIKHPPRGEDPFFDCWAINLSSKQCQIRQISPSAPLTRFDIYISEKEKEYEERKRERMLVRSESARRKHTEEKRTIKRYFCMTFFYKPQQ